MYTAESSSAEGFIFFNKPSTAPSAVTTPAAITPGAPNPKPREAIEPVDVAPDIAPVAMPAAVPPFASGTNACAIDKTIGAAKAAF